MQERNLIGLHRKRCTTRATGGKPGAQVFKVLQRGRGAGYNWETNGKMGWVPLGQLVQLGTRNGMRRENDTV